MDKEIERLNKKIEYLQAKVDLLLRGIYTADEMVLVKAYELDKAYGYADEEYEYEQ